MDERDIERAVVAQALYKGVAEVASAREPGSLRSRLDEHYLALYEQTGARSFEARVGGKKVGTVSVTVEEGETAEQVDDEVRDRAAFMDWCIEHGFTRVEPDLAAVRRHVERTGELPDGMERVRRQVQVKAPQRRVSLRVDVAKVADALRGREVEPVAEWLLGGADG